MKNSTCASPLTLVTNVRAGHSGLDRSAREWNIERNGHPGSGSDLPVVRPSAKQGNRARPDSQLSTYAMGVNESDRREPGYRRTTL